jgi:nucleoside-diphosphate-sugar epimerase
VVAAEGARAASSRSNVCHAGPGSQARIGMATIDAPIVLVTGASGLIGSRLVAALAHRYRVIGLDVDDPPPDWRGAAFVRCDLTDDEAAAAALEKVRREHGDRVASVVHLAAYYDFAGEPSPLYRTLTVEGTRRLLQGLRRFETVGQLIFSSTLLVMEPVDDEDDVLTERSPTRGEWDYPQSKIEAEKVLRAEHGDIPVVILRIAGAYDEDGHSPPLTQHIARIYEKTFESYFFPGDPSHGQPFVHLDDLVQCFVLAIDRRKQLSSFEVFLVAEPDVTSYDDLQDCIGELVHGKEWPTIRIPAPMAKAGAWVQEKLAPEGEEPFIRAWMVDLADDHYPASIRRVRERLGWEPRHRLRDVLPLMVQRMHRDPLGFYERNALPLPPDLQRALERVEQRTGSEGRRR